ncbi:hypothetical protein Pla52o_32520 [Novipirellula galeiformis]|uniref:Tetratricopeptide repeat protein n=1 Tax=Novipirellula galeiformis TaxID=2528004 RepID=A0A5C6CEL9_9BACT|nr:hypothetical protein [Novipirellula galeiformis]TWU22197.1 hypothetical protein Pla52o_32520 [Novipirellula galeiformis]
MKKTLLSTALFAACSLGLLTGSGSALAQNPVLSEMYGRGVHAFYAGQLDDANQFLSMAIDNGIKDPRAFYFRGLVANTQGRQFEAEADWRQGAELEASSGGNPSIGRSLARFQGPERLKLEQVRQTARLEMMATAAKRSQQRYGEIDAAAPAAAAPASSAGKTAAPQKPIAPPPIPPAADNPFADDIEMKTGDPKLQSNDAFAGAADAEAGMPAASEAPADAAAAPAADPFGAGAAPAADPFGGDAPMDDPFAF